MSTRGRVRAGRGFGVRAMSRFTLGRITAPLLITLLGCGPSASPGDYTIVNIQQNSMPVGFIQGRVFDSASGTPVPGATVKTVVESEVIAVSNGEGNYRLGPIPAGSYTVYVSAVGFLTRTASVAVQPAASMFPAGNTVVTRDVDLSRPDATIEGLVVTSTGELAAGADLYLDLRPQGFDLVVKREADAAGKFSISGLPGSALGQPAQLNVAPYDENEDGSPDYAAQARTYTLFPGNATYNTITLAALGVQLITSNVSDGDLLPTDAVTLTFNGQLRTNQSTLTLFRNAGNVQIGAAVKWDVGNTVGTLTPVGGKLVEGQAYYLVYSVRAVNGALTSGQLPFVARPPGNAPPPGDVQGFRVVLPGTMSYDSTLASLTLAWALLPEASGYRVYGKDAAMSSAYLLLANLASGAVTSATISLSHFDSVGGDAFSTPLGHSNIVKLTIVATDRVGNESAFATAPTIDLRDTVPPRVASGSQLAGTANNLAGGAAAEVAFQLTMSELISTDAMPQIVLPNGATSAVFAWQTVNRGVLTITVPAGVDGRGVLSVNGTRDTSGNVQTVAWEGTLF